MEARFIKSYADPGLVPDTGLPQIVMMGRSNSGKSSLINSVTSVKDLAKTSAAPGLTKLINIFQIGKLYELVDLPGYGYAKMNLNDRQKLIVMLSRFLSIAKRIKLVVIILDARHGVTPIDQEVIDQVQQAEWPYLLVANKVDKLTRSEHAQVLQKLKKDFPGITVISHSNKSGDGRGLLSDAFLRAAQGKAQDQSA